MIRDLTSFGLGGVAYAAMALTYDYVDKNYINIPNPDKPLGPINKFPDLPLIRLFCINREIGRIAQVCKKWRDLTNSPLFYEEMMEFHRTKIFNARDWIKYYGNPDEIPPLDEEIKKRFCRYPSYLILMPRELIRPDRIEPTPLNLRTIAEWSRDPFPESDGYPASYDPAAWQQAIDLDIVTPKTEWVVIGENLIYDKTNFYNQVYYIGCRGGQVPGLLNLVTLLFTQKVMMGRTPFMVDPAQNLFNRVCVWEVIPGVWPNRTSRDIRIGVSFTPNGVTIVSQDEDRDKYVATLMEMKISYRSRPSQPPGEMPIIDLSVYDWG